MQPVRKALHIFLFLFISQFLEPLHVGALEELIVDDDGNFVSAADVPISCRVLNELDTDIDVYYDDDTPAGVYMFSVNKMEARGLNTFPGHRFYARRKGASVNGEIVTDYMSSRGPPDADIIFSRRFSRENGEKHHPSIFSVDEPYPEVDADAYPRITYFKDRPEQVTQVPAKFRSLSPRPIELFYDDGSKEGVIQAALQLGTESTTNSYLGHTFVARPQGDKTTEIARFTISREKFLYLIFDDQDKYPAPKNLLDLSTEEERFNSEYVKKNGFLWRHYYGRDGPRPAPKLHHWPADEIGMMHSIKSKNSFWNCAPPSKNCRTSGDITLTLKAVSLQPRIFLIPRFLSDFESEQIMKLASTRVSESIVGSYDGGGARKSTTRTSRNTWIKRNTNELTETLFKRAADVLGLDDDILHTNRNAEDLQVVHYVKGQKYDSHHDWGVSGYPESRFITMLIYLTDAPSQASGGETSFPKARLTERHARGANGTVGLKVHPKKGSAVLFYNLLEDGNGDDDALHAALPVIEGEKWLCNFWVWDSRRRT